MSKKILSRILLLPSAKTLYIMIFDKVFYEPQALDFPLGKLLAEKFAHLDWIEIDSHNKIPQLSSRPNEDFIKMKKHLIIGTRKTHNYVPNEKVSDFLVPFTSSGCAAMCLYCYLVCNYNKCSYLRLFVNVEQMLSRLIKKSHTYDSAKTFEIGSNSDLILENTITNNLPYVIEQFGALGKGHITFPTKFDSVDSLLNLNHKGKTIFRMSLNPQEIIRNIEIGTSPLKKRLTALEKMKTAGYAVGILIAPIILLEDYKSQYSNLIDEIADTLCQDTKNNLDIELIFMTYSYVHRMINSAAFPSLPDLYSQSLTSPSGRGKYYYKPSVKSTSAQFFIDKISAALPSSNIVYIC